MGAGFAGPVWLQGKLEGGTALRGDRRPEMPVCGTSRTQARIWPTLAASESSTDHDNGRRVHSLEGCYPMTMIKCI